MVRPGGLRGSGTCLGDAVRRPEDDCGQAFVLLVGAMLAVVVGAVALGWLGAGLASAGDRQRVADLAALSAARALLDARPRALGDGAPAMRREDYIGIARARAITTARRNGASEVEIRFPDVPLPDTVTVVVHDAIEIPGAGTVGGAATARAAIGGDGAAAIADGDYGGSMAYRDGKPMRPDVALAFDRMERAARRAGHALVVTSGYRTAAEQARLFAANPDPRWVARPGRSLHRLGTELDLGPSSAYAWLAANSSRFGFIKRYSWEPWHFGLGRSPGSSSAGFSPPGGGSSGAVPSWVPPQYADPIRASAQRWSVGAAVLAAQLQQESGFNPRAVSRAGALGIAQFMPGTARAYGLRDPLDPAAAIDAQAHHMSDLLRRFGSVPLALAAYNAGPGRVASCSCVPPIPETQRYVQRITALARGLSGAMAGDAGALVRLVR